MIFESQISSRKMCISIVILTLRMRMRFKNRTPDHRKKGQRIKKDPVYKFSRTYNYDFNGDTVCFTRK